MFNITSFFAFKSKAPKKVIITFTGGMGAQILSAAIYFSMRNSGKEVYADLTYFDTPESIAIEGQIGQPSHWAWQLKPFGLMPSDFESYTGEKVASEDLIVDGSRKISLALSALQSKDVQRYFPIANSTDDIYDFDGTSYVCVHIRRGDYLNVASHLISDEVFLESTHKFSSLCETLVVVSDSSISQSLKNNFCNQYKNCVFLDSIDAISTHYLMRKASVLICSNSQFSLTAGALNTTGLVLIPKYWGDADGITKTIGLFGHFQTLSGCE
jgi:hypothetical protein